MFLHVLPLKFGKFDERFFFAQTTFISRGCTLPTYRSVRTHIKHEILLKKALKTSVWHGFQSTEMGKYVSEKLSCGIKSPLDFYIKSKFSLDIQKCNKKYKSGLVDRETSVQIVFLGLRSINSFKKNIVRDQEPALVVYKSICP